MAINDIIRVKYRQIFETGTTCIYGYRRAQFAETARALAWAIPREFLEDLLALRGRAGVREFIATKKAEMRDLLENRPESLPIKHQLESIEMRFVDLPRLNAA